MKQKISKRKIFKISAAISGVLCLSGVLVFGFLSKIYDFDHEVAKTANAYWDDTYWALIDGTNSTGDCTDAPPAGLGGSFFAGICTISSSTTITNKTVIVTGGGTLAGNDNLTIEFTTPNPQDGSWNPANGVSNPHGAALILIGTPSAPPLFANSVSGVTVQGNGHLAHGVAMEGVGNTLSGSTISGAYKSSILVAKGSGTFNLTSNTTSGGAIGVEVMHYASNGTIDDHTASGHSDYGIEIFGTNSVDVINSNLTGNGIGLYLHDAEWLEVYGWLDPWGPGNATVNSTYNYVDNNIITDNTTYDIQIDLTDANAWDAAQSTAANAYQTLNEIGGTFPTSSPAYADIFVKVNNTPETCAAVLGGSYSSGTCTVSSPVILENQTLIVTGGADIVGNDNIYISFTAWDPNSLQSSPDRSASQAIGLVLVGEPNITPASPNSVDGVIIYGNDYMAHGVVMEGTGNTLSNSEVYDAYLSNILVTEGASDFTLQSNTTSGGAKGIEVEFYATDGIIDDHNASSHTSYGIEIYGTDSVEITNSTLTGNGIYGLYIHDAVRSDLYLTLYSSDLTINNTYSFVDGNTITGNTSYDIAVDVQDANAWVADQYTIAENTYNTLYEINGEFPEAPTGVPDPPPTLQTSDTFNLTVDVNSYQSIENDCPSGISLAVPAIGEPLSAQDGRRYGKGSCGITIVHNDPTADFYLDLGKTQPALIGDTYALTPAHEIPEINNAGQADCLIDTSGNTDEEKIGYKLQSVVLEPGFNVSADKNGECNSIIGEITVYYDGTRNLGAPTPPYEHLFDLEYSEGADVDTVIYKIGGTSVCLGTDCTFDLQVEANIAWDTYANLTGGLPQSPDYGSYAYYSGTSNPYTIKLTSTTAP